MDPDSGGTGISHYYALSSGLKLLEFELVSVLGQGGFGITYLAQDTLLQEPVALKEFFPSDRAARVGDLSVRARTNSEQPEFEAGLKAFLEEARLMARFRHRNIVYVRRFFEAHGTAYIVQDYERGATLSKRLDGGPLDESQLRAVLSGILDGLEALHERAVLHRDLKPDNIIIREDGSPVLIDFGAARDFAGRHSRSITAIASGGYTPPEQWGAGGQQGPWSDLYALGAITYRCVTGTAPPISLQRLRNDPLTPASVAAAGKYAPPLLAAIDWMLKVDEEKRPSSVAAVRRALEGEAPPEIAMAARAAVEALGGGAPGNAPSAMTIEPADAGRTVLKFDRDIVSDVLELAIEVTPPGSYLGKSAQEPLSPAPVYFTLYRKESTRDAFVVEADVAARIESGANVRVLSRDGFIRAAGVWPAASTRSKRTVPRWAKLVAAACLAFVAAGGSYSLYSAQQARNAETRRLQLHQQLEAAKYDRGAIDGVLRACEPSCPPDVKTAAQSKLDLIASEDQTFQASQDDLAKIRTYLADCKACIRQPEALARSEVLLARQAEAARKAEEAQYRAARGTRADLQRYLDSCKTCAFAADARSEIASLERTRLTNKLSATNGKSNLQNFLNSECGSACPADIRARAEGRLQAIERETRDYNQAIAAEEVQSLRSYVSTCQECTQIDEARRKISELTDFFRFKVCNQSGRKTSVAIMGTRKGADEVRVVGWYTFQNGECSSIGTFKSGLFYYAAEVYDNSRITWQGTLALCVRNKAFDRLKVPNYKCKNEERLLKFFERTITGPTYTWTMNP